MMYWDKLGSGYQRDNLNLVDPITGKKIKTIKAQPRKETGQSALTYLDVTMVFHSFRGPNDEDRGKASLRKGVDVRAILYIQTLFHVLNSFWAKKPAPYPVNTTPEIKTYKCIPITKVFGCVEILEPMLNIKHFVWSSIAQASEDKKLSLLSSLAAAVTVSWVLGFKDKLEEVLYIHNDQIVLYGIEKIHLWQARPFDADFIQRIKPQLTILHPNGWNVFYELCAETFKILHEKGSVLIDICSTLYTGLYEKPVIEEFFTGNRGLMTTVNALEALAYYSLALTDAAKPGFFKKLRIKT